MPRPLRRPRAVLLAVALLALLVPNAAAHDPGPNHFDPSSAIDVDLAAAADRTAATALRRFLPRVWCGTERTTDNTANARLVPTLPQFKLIYAHASDEPNRFAEWADTLQANVAIIQRFMAGQSGRTKVPRWDMGTDCGPEFVDVQVVHLPRIRANYHTNFDAIRNDVAAAVGTAPGPRNYIVFADRINHKEAGGEGQLVQTAHGGDVVGTDNPHNRGGLTSVVYVHRPAIIPADPRAGWSPEVMLHEMGHNLGAVQHSAPHSTAAPGSSDYQYSHCWDGEDIMCYDDGDQISHPHETTHCGATTDFLVKETFDCNRDDYFDPSPPAGTRFSRHWNVYENLFMGDCSALEAGCGWNGATPYQWVPPAIVGEEKETRELIVGEGAWNHTQIAYGYQWQRELASGWADIPGANAKRYVPAAGDVDKRLRARVTAYIHSGSAVAHSQPTERIAALVGPEIRESPQVSGTPKRGQVLEATRGVWTGDATRFYPAWERLTANGWARIPGATSWGYTLAADDVGARVRVVVRAWNDDHYSERISGMVGPVADLTLPRATTPLQLSGRAVTGAELRIQPGTWSVPPVVVQYRWERLAAGVWTEIAGEHSATRVLTDDDLATSVRGVAIAWSAEGSSRAYTAATTPVERALPPVHSSLPAVSGAPLVERTLTASTGGWSRATSFAYQWEELFFGRWVPVWGATEATFTPPRELFERPVRVVVTARNADGSVRATSAETAPLGSLPHPGDDFAVSGTARVGSSVYLGAEEWDHDDRSEYRWQRQENGVWTDIPGATSTAYVVGEQDGGLRLRLAVTAFNAHGSTTAHTPATEPALVPPRPSEPPTISGRLRPGRTLTADPGKWVGATSLRYAWFTTARGWVAGATSNTLTLAPADRYAYVRVRVYATGPDGETWEDSVTYGLVEGWSPPVAGGTPRLELLGGGAWKPGELVYARGHDFGTFCAAQTVRHERLAGGTWTPRDGSSTELRLTAADVGHRLRTHITCTNQDGTATATTAPSEVVVALEPPVNTAAPVVTGTTKVGRDVVTTLGGWSGQTSTVVVWEQRRDGGAWEEIDRLHDASLRLRGAQVGAQVRARVIARNADGATVAASEPTAVVAGYDVPIMDAAPSIRGVPRAGHTLTADPGTWRASSGHQLWWQRRLPGGRWQTVGDGDGTYVPTAEDAGGFLRLTVKADGVDFDEYVESDEVGPVASAELPAVLTAPSVGGLARRGGVLVALRGRWERARAYVHRWERRTANVWSPIEGATAAHYAVSGADAGADIRVVVTATNDDGATESASAAVRVDGPVLPVLAAAPRIEGEVRPGATVRATAAAWRGALAGERLLWERSVDGTTWSAVADGSSYVVRESDAGTRLRVRSIADGEEGVADGASEPTGWVPRLVRADDPRPPAPPALPAPVVRTPAPAPPVVVTGPRTAIPPSDPPRETTPDLVVRRGGRTVLSAGVARTGTRAVVSVRRAALPDGRYTVRACAGSRCATQRVRIRSGRVQRPAPLSLRAPRAAKVTVSVGKLRGVAG